MADDEEIDPVLDNVPDGPDESAAAAAPEAAEPVADPGPDYSEFGLGDEWRGKDPLEVARHLHNASAEREEQWSRKFKEETQQAYEYAQNQFRAAPAWREFQSWQDEQKKQKAAAEPPKEKTWWKPIQRDPAWEKEWIETDENGQARVRPGAPAEFLDYLKQRRRHAEQLAENPVEYLGGYMKEYGSEILPDLIAPHAKNWIKEYLDQERESQAVEEFHEKNASWMFMGEEVTLANGATHFIPSRGPSGQPDLSPEGAKFVTYVNHLLTNGYTSTRKAQSDAVKFLFGDVAHLQSTKLEKELAALRKKQPSKTADPDDEDGEEEDRHDQYARKVAKRTAARGGSLESPESPRKPKNQRGPSWEDEAVAEFERRMNLTARR